MEQLEPKPKRLWFKRRYYGWGWYPVTWQGWTVLAVFLGLVLWISLSLDNKGEPTTSDIVWFYVKEVLLIAALIAVCYKTGEKPRWQWGPPKKTDDSESK